ncbi:hypothetical protein XPA_006864 [Xanthoria parietina]
MQTAWEDITDDASSYEIRHTAQQSNMNNLMPFWSLLPDIYDGGHDRKKSHGELMQMYDGWDATRLESHLASTPWPGEEGFQMLTTIVIPLRYRPSIWYALVVQNCLITSYF